MPFFESGAVRASIPDRTIWQRLPGVRVRGCALEVEVECRWYQNPDMLAAHVRSSLHQHTDDAAKAAALDAAIASCVIVNWRNVPRVDGEGDEPYSVEGCTELLALFRQVVMLRGDELVVPFTEFMHACNEAKRFGVEPVDPVDLGKE